MLALTLGAAPQIIRVRYDPNGLVTSEYRNYGDKDRAECVDCVGDTVSLNIVAIVSITFIGLPTRSYRVEASEDLETWDRITSTFSGQYTNIIHVPAVGPHTFYRILEIQ